MNTVGNSDVPQDRLVSFIQDLDDVVVDYMDMGPHIITGALLSRIVLLMQSEPTVGKNLIRYAWEKLDDLEQNLPPNVEE